MTKKILIRLSPKLIYLTKKKLFKIKYLICFVILFFLIYEIYTIFQLPPYPYEPNQKNVDDLLTKEEFKNIFQPYLYDLKCLNNSICFAKFKSFGFDRKKIIVELTSLTHLAHVSLIACLLLKLVVAELIATKVIELFKHFKSYKYG